MRHVIPRFPQRSALRCAALLGALLLIGSLGVSEASAASSTPGESSREHVDLPVRGRGDVQVTEGTNALPTSGPASLVPTAAPGQSASGSGTTNPSATDDASGAPGASPTSPAPSTDPADPSQTAEPTDPTGKPTDSSSPSVGPAPSPTESSEPFPAPPTSTEPTRPSTLPKPSHHETTTTRPSGGGTSSSSGHDGSQGWTSAAGGRQYSNNGPRAVEQGGQRDVRTGFQVDAATGFPIHPGTGLLIDPFNGRMLSRGSLEPSDFNYDFASGQIRLATLDRTSGGSAPDPTTASSGGGTSSHDGTTAPAGDTGDGVQAQQEDTSPTASIGMSPSTMTVVLASLVVLGGLWYFFVFVRRPRTKPQHRE